MVPALDSEIGRHFGNARPYDRALRSEVFKGKCELLPHYIRNNLTVRILHENPDLRGRNPAVKRLVIRSVESNASALLSEGRKLFLQKVKKRGFAAAGRAAQNRKGPFPYGICHVRKRGLLPVRIRKRQIFDL